MGGVEPAGDYVLELLSPRQARRHGEQAARRPARRRALRRRLGRGRAAALRGERLRGDPGDQGAARVARRHERAPRARDRQRHDQLHAHRDGGGSTYDEALAEAQRRGFAEADPTDDVSGADAAAKMAILATVAFNSRFELADVEVVGIDSIDPLDIAAARELEMVIRLVGSARLVDGHVDVRVRPALVDRHHPLASVAGAFNAVMLQGDAIREITLEGPGAGGVETASAVIADMASVIGTMGTGFLQNDAVWRELPRLPPGDNRSPWYFHLSVDDRPGVLAHVAEELAEREISIARLLQHQNGDGAALHVVTHEAREGSLERRAGGDHRARRGAPQAAALSRRLRSRRCGARMGVIERYRDRLPVGPGTPLLTLGEGGTPLVRSERLSARLGVELYFKCEGANPTGSFKDRGMAVAVAKAVEDGRRGNRLRLDREHRRFGRRLRGAGRDAGRRAAPRGRDRGGEAGAVARGRRARARDPRLVRRRAPQLPGARRPRARSRSSTRSTRTGSRARRRPRSRSSRSSAARRTWSRCPTAAAATSARTRRASRRRACARGSSRARRPSERVTIASAIRIAEPAHLDEVTALVAEGRAEIVTVADEEITDAWLELASLEGIFCEPSSAAGLAAPRAHRARARQHGRLRPHRPRPEGHGRGRRADRGHDGRRREPRSDPRGGGPVTLWTVRHTSVTVPGTGHGPKGSPRAGISHFPVAHLVPLSVTAAAGPAGRDWTGPVGR